MKCKHRDCKWQLRAALLGTSFGWTVRKYVNTHSCSSSIMRRDHCQAKSRIIGSYIKTNFKNVKCIYKPKNIVNDIHKDFGVNISYDKAWKSREQALDMIRGGAEESFQLIPSYLYMLKLNNLRTITEFESDSGNKFKYLFMEIGACLAKFRSKMRPVITVDACFLKGKYIGSLFVATCKDGNNHVYPIAWGVGDSENHASWEWFFNKLRSTIGDEILDLVFVFDQHKSIHKEVMTVFPNSLHVSSIGAYLREVSFSPWAHAYSDGKRFDIKMTNIAECLNAALADTPWAEGEIAKRLALSQYWRLEPIDMYRFNVHNGHFGGIIDLKIKTCTCRVFDFNKLSCGHALATARSRNIDPYTLCSSYYQTEALLCAYADLIMYVGS
ncbi:uncharacterized protein LOC127812712 [Diospyros lotus]|uniref:uncharacterized protein LOC127812712 n=1 Tax=Diospyros lotus TaxID=55363 RepID=UPI0022583C07|nr:uncharacterized protein LOC127812712 [Diospyros lotus]